MTIGRARATDTERILSVSRGTLGVFSGASVRPAVPVVVALAAGPGVASPKNRLSGCETGHAGFESFLLALPGPRCSAAETVGVGEELSVDGVADVSLQRPQCFSFGLALGDFAFEVGATLAVFVAQLSDGGHMDRRVQRPVPSSRQSVCDPAAGGELDGRGAGVRGEVITVAEPADVTGVADQD